MPEIANDRKFEDVCSFYNIELTNTTPPGDDFSIVLTDFNDKNPQVLVFAKSDIPRMIRELTKLIEP